MYKNISPTGTVNVTDDEAFDYAKSHLDEMPEHDKKEFVRWFFSGNWVREAEDEAI